MKKVILLLLLLCVSVPSMAQHHFIMQLWPDGVPESNGLTEQKDGSSFHSVTDPQLWVYLPERSKANGQALVVCPGGGYEGLAFAHEGTEPAKWLAEQGVVGIVLKYRMPNGYYEIPRKDVLRAIEIVRDSATRWNVNPNRVGVMGSSAGGHLAATAATHFSSAKNRPDFAVLLYPVITMKEELTHHGSRRRLIGEGYNAKLMAEFCNELRVTRDTPPTFIAFSDDDDVVDPRNGTLFYDALKASGVPAEVHIYPTGGHGWGWHKHFKYAQEFRASLALWLSDMPHDTRN